MIPYFQVTTIELGPITLQAWGTMLALAFAVGIYFSARELKNRGGDPEKIVDASFWVIISAMLGARFFYVLGNLDLFRENWLDAFKIWEGGATLVGGIIGAVAAFIIYVKRNKIDFWKLIEPVSFILPLSVFIGRIGCFLIHDHMGKITSVPWGMRYFDGTIRHETSLYNGLSMLIIFFIFLFLRRFSGSKKQGFYTTIFLLWYGITRFIADFYRADDLPMSDSRWYGLTPNQYAAMAIICLGLYLNKRYKIINLKKENI